MVKRAFLIFLLIIFSLTSFSCAGQSKKILMIIASQNFRDEELLTPKKNL